MYIEHGKILCQHQCQCQFLSITVHTGKLQQRKHVSISQSVCSRPTQNKI